MLGPAASPAQGPMTCPCWPQDLAMGRLLEPLLAGAGCSLCLAPFQGDSSHLQGTSCLCLGGGQLSWGCQCLSSTLPALPQLLRTLSQTRSQGRDCGPAGRLPPGRLPRSHSARLWLRSLGSETSLGCPSGCSGRSEGLSSLFPSSLQSLHPLVTPLDVWWRPRYFEF